MALVLVFCTPMKTARKVTVILPAELLRRAQKSTGKGITPTIRRGLELVAAAKAYQQLRQLRGRVKFSVDLNSLREDRDRD
jgi:hypothetical protein